MSLIYNLALYWSNPDSWSQTSGETQADILAGPPEDGMYSKHLALMHKCGVSLKTIRPLIMCIEAQVGVYWKGISRASACGMKCPIIKYECCTFKFLAGTLRINFGLIWQI